MPKMLRRMTTIILAIVITAATALPAASLSEESLDKSMETALIAAKSLIDIDDDIYTEFNYYSSFSNYETREGLIWRFSWYNNVSGEIYASVTGEGTLLGFDKYDWDSRPFGFAKIGKDAAMVAADGFIKKANPDTYQYYKSESGATTSIHSSDYGINYTAVINGYPFDASYISVRIDKNTGEVTGYYTSNISPDKYRFEDAAELISENAAAAAYAEKIGLSLSYNSNYDYESSKLTVFPVYTFNSYGDCYISAKTGEVVNYVYDRGLEGGKYAYDDYSMSPLMAGADAAETGRSANLTPAERSAIENVAGFLTSEQALAKLLEAAALPKLDTSVFEGQYINLNRDYVDKDRYIYDIYMYNYSDYSETFDTIGSINGRVDATTGRVLAFDYNYSGFPSSDKLAMNFSQAETAAEAFLRRMAPGEFAKTKLETKSDFDPDVYEYYWSSYKWGSYYFSYTRYENDIPFRDNRISVTINAYTGKITGYSLDWYEKITFPSISNVLTPQQAITVFVAQIGSEIKYITTGEGNTALVYDFDSWLYIDPYTGKGIDYTGDPLSDPSILPDYTDVKGHWSDSYVTKLFDNGVYQWGGKFEPDKVMTEYEFLQYILLADQYSYARIDPQMYFKQRGVDVEASPDKPLTRQEAVRIIVEYLGYGKLAKQSEWFVYPFTDSVTDSHKGYITICYMLGIINGDNGGRFNGSNNVTRAHAAVLLHNLIIAQS